MRHSKFSLLVLSVSFVVSTLVVASTPSRANAVQSACPSWVRVIDISSNDIHPMDWKKMVRWGVAGAYIKNTEATNYTNPYFAKDTQDATKAGVPWGVYHFAQPGKADAVASAKYFVAQGGGRGQLPPALDLEVTTLNPQKTAEWALVWLKTVESLTKRRPIIYVGYYFPASQYPFLAPYDLWLPAYPNGYNKVPNVCALSRPRIPAPWAQRGWSLWQFTSMAYMDGKHGRSDLSVALPEWFSKWTGAGIMPTDNPNKPADPLYSDGSHGTKVVQIQNILINQNLLPKGSADGIFGVQTKRALEKYQQRIGVKADGMWSVETQTASDFFLKNKYTMAQAKQWKAMGEIMKAHDLSGIIKEL